jgi:hypothetical protein
MASARRASITCTELKPLDINGISLRATVPRDVHELFRIPDD